MSETMKRLEAAICEPRTFMEHLQQPHAIEFDGELWVAMTSGHVLVAVKGTRESGQVDAELQPDRADRFRRVMAQADATDWAGVDSAAMLAWAKERGAGLKCERPCLECHGRKTVLCECDCGEHSHRARCDECGGRGVVMSYPERVEAWVHGVYLDLNLLRTVLEYVEPGEVRIAKGRHGDPRQEYNCLHLRTETWRAVVMGLRSDHDINGAPRWEPATAEVTP